MAQTVSLDALQPKQIDATELLSFWNQAQPDEFAITARLLERWLYAEPWRGTHTMLALRQAGALVGVALTSTPPDYPPDGMGLIDGLVVAPGASRSALRRRLLAATEESLRGQGCQSLQWGNSAYGLVRGVPYDRRTSDALQRLGYIDAGRVYDMVADVTRYRRMDDVDSPRGVVRAMQWRERTAIGELLAGPMVAASGEKLDGNNMLPIDHTLEAEQLSDFMLLWTDRGVKGMALVAFSDANWPLELTYPYTLPRPWGALPMVLVAQGEPPGAFTLLIDAALRRFFDNGVKSCVAPGVLTTAPFTQARFKVFRTWQRLVKWL